MENQTYFWFEITEDGEMRIKEFLDKEELEDYINDEDEFIDPDGFKASVGENEDPQYWGGKRVLIVKGKIVVPHQEKVVTKLKIE